MLAPKPGYPLIESIARLECVDTIAYQLQYDGSWFIDTAELEALLDGADGARIRALVLINPNIRQVPMSSRPNVRPSWRCAGRMTWR